jgi:hypothetical protein
LRAKGDKTELTLRQEGLGSVSNRDDHGKGWNGTLNKLDAYLAAGKALTLRDPAAQDEQSSSKPDRLPKPSRVELRKSAEIPASASDVWNLLTDWAGMLRWWLTVEQGGLAGLTLVKCDLVGEHGAVPRTRRITLDSGAVVEEQIFYQNDETRRLYYSRSESAGSEISGYIATTFVDEIETDRCTMHISSWFDVRSQVDAQAAADRFDAVYRAIFNGFQKYFSKDMSG